MQRTVLSILLISMATLVCAQNITGEQLLDAAIEYHDPSGKWKNFSGVMTIELSMPGKPKRYSEVTIDLPNEYFALVNTREGNTTNYEYEKGECQITHNGKTTFTDEEVKQHGLTCDRATLMSDYYSYLYGLPMKLKDPGTVLDSEVQRKEFQGKAYDVLKVTYEKKVGDDIWYFYFDTETHAMEVYQFFHDESKNDGEYILLKGELNYNGIKIPKDRTWYYNKDNKLLGKDYLVSIQDRK